MENSQPFVSIDLDGKMDDFLMVEQSLRDVANSDRVKCVQYVISDVKDAEGCGALLMDLVKESGIDPNKVRIACEESPKEREARAALPHEKANFSKAKSKFTTADFDPIIPCTRGWSAMIFAPVSKSEYFTKADRGCIALGHNFDASGFSPTTFVNRDGQQWIFANNSGSADGPELGRFTEEELQPFIKDSPTLQDLMDPAMDNSCYFGAKQLLKFEVKAGIRKLPVDKAEQDELFKELGQQIKAARTSDLTPFADRCVEVYKALKKKGDIKAIPRIENGAIENPSGLYLDRVFEQFVLGMEIECTDLQQYLMWCYMPECHTPVYLAPQKEKFRFTTFYKTFEGQPETNMKACMGVTRKRLREVFAKVCAESPQDKKAKCPIL